MLHKFVLTFRSLSNATPASNVSLPSSSTVTAASLDNVKPDANGCPELLTESSYLICTLLMVTLRFPIIVDIKLYSHELLPGTGPPFELLLVASRVAASAACG
jgi:hypothetical protein